MLKFPYNPRKAAQTAAYLVGVHGGTMNMYALVKIMYLCDRKSLLERGYPITGDAMVSMPYGPVLSRLYDQMKNPEEMQDESWRQYMVEREGHSISLREPNPPTDELSQYERELLAKADESYGRCSFGALKEIVDRLPEYVDPNGSSNPIDPATILRNAGWSNEEIEDCAASASEMIFFAGQRR